MDIQVEEYGIGVTLISYVIPVYIDNESVGIIGMDISLATIESLISEANILVSVGFQTAVCLT